MAIFFDTHAHLDYPDFSADLPQIIERAHVAGITKMISIGTSLESSKRAVALAEKHEAIYAVVGWHPTDVMDAPADVKSPLRELAKNPKVVAIGETGLDFFRMPSKNGGSIEDDEKFKARQADVFQQQLELAAELNLNCVIHTRASFDETLAQMQPFAGKVRGVFHCFAEAPEKMRRVLEINSLVSFTGILTFKNGQNIRDTLAATPLDKFMLETDCPFLAPIPYRGKRNEPAYVKEIAEIAAQVKNCSMEELSAKTCETAREFFRKL
jgi:TatD DNase family protein